MSLIQRLLGSTFPRLDPDDARAWSEWSPRVAAGVYVDSTRAMQIAAVWAAVRLVSESVAMIPLHMYRRRNDGGKDQAREHPIEELISRNPNPWMTSFEFREMMQGHVELRGNAFAEIVPGRRGAVDQLIPIHPDRVRIEQESDGSLIYRVRMPKRTTSGGVRRTGFPTEDYERVLLQDEVFHLRGISSDGIAGLSTIAYARESMGLSIAAEEYGARMFSQSARPSGVLQTDQKLGSEAFKRLKADWERMHTGVQNAGKVAILEEGLTWQQMGLTNEDAQFLESRKFQINEVARWFRVPPHMIADLERATFSNIEEMGLEFVVYSLMARLRRWEQAIARSLILRDDVYFAEFNIDGLLRGDINSRYQAYAIARQWGWMSVNEIRARENLNPIEDGDEYLRPMNMTPLGTDPETEAAIARSRELVLASIGHERNGHGHE